MNAPTLWTAIAVLAAAFIVSRGLGRARWASSGTVAAPGSGPRVHQTASPGLGEDRSTEEAAGVTLSEERLQIDRRRRPRERVRMRKYVVTEYVTVRVPVRREEVSLERIPLDDDDPGEAGEHEIVLMDEEPVIR